MRSPLLRVLGRQRQVLDGPGSETVVLNGLLFGQQWQLEFWIDTWVLSSSSCRDLRFQPIRP
jgi:hypothetical protein